MPKFRLGRFTLRASMVAVALSALATFGWVLWGRSAEYALKAEVYRGRMNICKNNVARARDTSHSIDPSAPLTYWQEEHAEFFQVRADHAQRLYQKYRRAAMFPWLTPEVDSPEPSPSIW